MLSYDAVAKITSKWNNAKQWRKYTLSLKRINYLLETLPAPS
jgi:hypothetical protein